MSTPDKSTKSPIHDLSKVVTSRPIDGTAARVISQGPKGYESGKKILSVCSPTPLPIRSIGKSERANPGFVDCVGVKRGKLTVLGIVDDRANIERSKSAQLRWLCRCVCGYYTTRSSKSIKNERNEQDACDRCRQVAYLKRTSHFRQTGQNKPITEFI